MKKVIHLAIVLVLACVVSPLQGQAKRSETFNQLMIDKLKNEGLVNAQREGTFLRYSADTAGLEGLLGFLYAECCTRNKAVEPKRILCCS